MESCVSIYNITNPSRFTDKTENIFNNNSTTKIIETLPGGLAVLHMEAWSFCRMIFWWGIYLTGNMNPSTPDFKLFEKEHHCSKNWLFFGFQVVVFVVSCFCRLFLRPVCLITRCTENLWPAFGSGLSREAAVSFLAKSPPSCTGFLVKFGEALLASYKWTALQLHMVRVEMFITMSSMES